MPMCVMHVNIYLMQAVDEAGCRQAVHDAFHAGVNYIDTSPFYGDTKAETVRCGRVHRGRGCSAG